MKFVVFVTKTTIEFYCSVFFFVHVFHCCININLTRQAPPPPITRPTRNNLNKLVKGTILKSFVTKCMLLTFWAIKIKKTNLYRTRPENAVTKPGVSTAMLLVFLVFLSFFIDCNNCLVSNNYLRSVWLEISLQGLNNWQNNKTTKQHSLYYTISQSRINPSAPQNTTVDRQSGNLCCDLCASGRMFHSTPVRSFNNNSRNVTCHWVCIVLH